METILNMEHETQNKTKVLKNSQGSETATGREQPGNKVLIGDNTLAPVQLWIPATELDECEYS